MLREPRFFLQQLGERWAPQDTDQTVKKKFTVVDHLRLRGAAGESYIEISYKLIININMRNEVIS